MRESTYAEDEEHRTDERGDEWETKPTRPFSQLHKGDRQNRQDRSYNFDIFFICFFLQLLYIYIFFSSALHTSIMPLV